MVEEKQKGHMDVVELREWIGEHRRLQAYKRALRQGCAPVRSVMTGTPLGALASLPMLLAIYI